MAVTTKTGYPVNTNNERCNLITSSSYVMTPNGNLDTVLTTLKNDIETKNIETNNRIWNPNLLHNWDFRNPVNQRGKNEYLGNGYTIDEWHLMKDSGPDASTLKLTANGIEITSPSDGHTIFEQTIEFSEQYANLPLTLSLKISTHNQGSGYFSTYSYNGTQYEVVTAIRDISSQEAGEIVSVSGAGNNIMNRMCIRILVVAGTTVICESIKLELGTVSTLANDPPMDYGAELAKCQRYQIHFHETFARALSVSTNYIEFFIPLPTTIRINPTLENIENISIHTVSEIEQNGFAYEIRPYKDNTGVLLRATKNSHGMPDAFIWFRDVILNANL